MFINFELVHLYIFLLILTVVLVTLRLRGRSFSHLFFVAIFDLYLIGAISVIVFPFVLARNNTLADVFHNVNLIPFNFGSCFDTMPENCTRAIYENILLTIPFGFLLQFIVWIKPKQTVWAILAIGCSFEFIQLIMALILRNSFRAIDINDVIFNTLGALIGFLLFRLFGSLYLFVIRKYDLHPKHIFAYIKDVVAPSSHLQPTTFKPFNS